MSDMQTQTMNSQSPKRQICIAQNNEFKKYFFIEDDKVVSTKVVKIVEGKEVECEEPSPGKYKLCFPGEFKIDVVEQETGKTTKTLDKMEQLALFPDLQLMVKAEEANQWHETLSALDSCNDQDKIKVKHALEEQIQENAKKHDTMPPHLQIDQVAHTLELLITGDTYEIPSDFYKNINAREEFGISRIVADMVYHLPGLLDDAKITRQGETSTYVIEAEIKNSYGHLLKLEHRLQATSNEEAERVAKLVIKRLKGIQLKIWSACWKMANTKGRYTFICPLTALMEECNPMREAYFNTSEKIEFYEHLRSLENTKFVLTKTLKSKNGKERYNSYELRLLDIHTHSGDKNEPPQQISMTILNRAALQNEKTTFVGVGIKNKTLELHADDTMLSTLIQTRKNQMMEAEYLKFERDSLLEIAGLGKTAKTNKTHANKLLLEKLSRLKDKGILLEIPKRINLHISLKVR